MAFVDRFCACAVNILVVHPVDPRNNARNERTKNNQCKVKMKAQYWTVVNCLLSLSSASASSAQIKASHKVYSLYPHHDEAAIGVGGQIVATVSIFSTFKRKFGSQRGVLLSNCHGWLQTQMCLIWVCSQQNRLTNKRYSYLNLSACASKVLCRKWKDHSERPFKVFQNNAIVDSADDQHSRRKHNWTWLLTFSPVKALQLPSLLMFL